MNQGNNTLQAISNDRSVVAVEMQIAEDLGQILQDNVQLIKDVTTNAKIQAVEGSNLTMSPQTLKTIMECTLIGVKTGREILALSRGKDEGGKSLLAELGFE